MSERFYTVLGMMSGTSCDGLDLALVRIGRVEGKWVFEWLATDTIEYTHVQRDELRSIRDVSSIELLKSHYDWEAIWENKPRVFEKSFIYTSGLHCLSWSYSFSSAAVRMDVSNGCRIGDCGNGAVACSM